MSTTHIPALPHAAHGVPTRLIVSLAAGAGFSVASIYYSQPMLGVISGGLGSSEQATGMVPTLTQLGYALGILLLAPLGDRFDRRRLILVKSLVLAAALTFAAIAGNLPTLLLASLLIGLMATVAQDVVPAAATLAPEAHRGAVVGKVMTGLLLGILLSRVASGLVAQTLGWRAMFGFAAGSVVVMALALARELPHMAPTTKLGYPALLRSLFGLWRGQPPLRRAVYAQGLLAVGFSAFWSTLAVMLHSRYQLGSAVAGAFGIAGAAGALAAPLAGRWADRLGSHAVARIAILIALVGFALLLLDPWLPKAAILPLLAVSAVVFDFGFQAALVSHQTLVYGLAPEARSRLNALLFTGVFLGMAAGGALGAVMLAHFGWSGVAGLAVVTAGMSFVVRRR